VRRENGSQVTAKPFFSWKKIGAPGLLKKHKVFVYAMRRTMKQTAFGWKNV